MKLGVDVLLADAALRRELAGRRVALLAHPASMTSDFRHTVDALAAHPDTRPVAALGPQHGMRGEKQDNMQESDDYVDPVHGIPVFSLYGTVRRPTSAMLDAFDVLLVDLQDVGTRVYTFLTTLLYVLEASAAAGKSVWVLDRPNPAGRPVEGPKLRPGCESFVGAGPLPMRHGLTLGEAAEWFRAARNLNVDLQIEEHYLAYRPSVVIDEVGPFLEAHTGTTLAPVTEALLAFAAPILRRRTWAGSICSSRPLARIRGWRCR